MAMACGTLALRAGELAAAGQTARLSNVHRARLHAAWNLHPLREALTPHGLQPQITAA